MFLRVDKRFLVRSWWFFVVVCAYIGASSVKEMCNSRKSHTGINQPSDELGAMVMLVASTQFFFLCRC